MRPILCLALFVAATPALAADLSRIERRIAKEPSYQSKAPGYCLLVFGAEAKTRVWIVRDGDTLFVDRNGNGDLTEPDKRIQRPANHQEFNLDRVVASGWMTSYPYLRLTTQRRGSADHFVIDFAVPGKYKQSVQSSPFGDRPETAPIIHLDGPLTVGLLIRKNGLHVPESTEQVKLSGTGGSTLIIYVGTPNIGKGAKPTCVMSCCDGPEPCGIQQPPSFYPTAVIEYPGTTQVGGGLTVTIRLDDD
jgi:hypothetical protein